MSLFWLTAAAALLLSLQEIHSVGNVTRIIRSSEILLRRQKRYLAFPKGSNLVLTMSFVKRVMQVQPKNWNVIGECDVPFPLPSDTRMFINQRKLLKRQRREIYSTLEESMKRTGLNGTACLKRFICDTQDYVLATKESNSLVTDLLSSLFTISEDGTPLDEFCSEEDAAYCDIPLFSYVIKSLGN